MVEGFTKSDLGPIVVIGGGAHSDLWCQIHADVMDRPIRRVEGYHHAGHAGRGAGGGRGPGPARPPTTSTGWWRWSGSSSPDRSTKATYDELYAAFLATYKATKDIHAGLNG